MNTYCYLHLIHRIKNASRINSLYLEQVLYILEKSLKVWNLTVLFSNNKKRHKNNWKKAPVLLAKLQA